MINNKNIKNNIKNYKKENKTILCGYACIFNVKDEQGDVILPEAINNIEEKNIPILWQHDVKKPIGRIIDMYKDDVGVFIYANIDENLFYGKEAKNAVLSKTIQNMSIGYQLVESFTSNNINYLQKIRIFEVSLVSLPANTLTCVKIL